MCDETMAGPCCFIMARRGRSKMRREILGSMLALVVASGTANAQVSAPQEGGRTPYRAVSDFNGPYGEAPEIPPYAAVPPAQPDAATCLVASFDAAARSMAAGAFFLADDLLPMSGVS